MKPRIKRRQVRWAESRARLILEKLRRTRMDTVNTGGISGAKCCDDTCPVADYERGERLQVRLKHA